ncbi:MAG: hypothetical protein HRU36_01165 [Rickettsiales bacterium]|nr:hypothetical protein [Rickettsiales bacterium]
MKISKQTLVKGEAIDCYDKVLQIHKALKETGKFDNLFDCVSSDEETRLLCQDSRLDHKEECELFTSIASQYINMPSSYHWYAYADKIVPCLPNSKDFWGVCDTAVEQSKGEEYCNNICGEIAEHTEL